MMKNAGLSPKPAVGMMHSAMILPKEILHFLHFLHCIRLLSVFSRAGLPPPMDKKLELGWGHGVGLARGLARAADEFQQHGGCRASGAAAQGGTIPQLLQKFQQNFFRPEKIHWGIQMLWYLLKKILLCISNLRWGLHCAAQNFWQGGLQLFGSPQGVRLQDKNSHPNLCVNLFPLHQTWQ